MTKTILACLMAAGLMWAPVAQLTSKAAAQTTQPAAEEGCEAKEGAERSH